MLTRNLKAAARMFAWYMKNTVPENMLKDLEIKELHHAIIYRVSFSRSFHEFVGDMDPEVLERFAQIVWDRYGEDALETVTVSENSSGDK